MAQFVKDNLIPILLAALLTVSGYLIEKTISNAAEIRIIHKQISDIRVSMRTLVSIINRKK